MTSFQKMGGLSAILAGITFAASLTLGIVVFLSAPPELFEQLQNGNIGVYLLFFAPNPSQRTMFTLVLIFQTISSLLMVPALLILYSFLKDIHYRNAIVATALTLTSLPFFILDALLGFPLVGPFVDSFAVASAAERASIVSILTFSTTFSQASVGVFYLFFGAALIIYSLTMLKGAFSRSLAWVGIAAGVANIGSAIGNLIGGTLQFTGIISSILLIAWFMAIGITLYRKRLAVG